MKNKKATRALILYLASALLMLAVVLLVACANNAANLAEDSNSNPTAVESVFPTGRFIRNHNDDLALEIEDGRFRLWYIGNKSSLDRLVDEGTFIINGNQFIIETDSLCEEFQLENATYNWSFDDETFILSLDGNRDDCMKRRASLNTIAYIRETE